MLGVDQTDSEQGQVLDWNGHLGRGAGVCKCSKLSSLKKRKVILVWKHALYPFILTGQTCRYVIYLSQLVSGITFFRYAQSQRIGKPNNFKMLGARKPQGLNKITKCR